MNTQERGIPIKIEPDNIVDSIILLQFETEYNQKKLILSWLLFRRVLILTTIPTRCTFWHYNIMVYGINSKNNEKYRLCDEKGYSNSQMTKVATALIHKLEDKIVLPQDMRKRYLSKKKYIKNPN